MEVETEGEVEVEQAVAGGVEVGVEVEQEVEGDTRALGSNNKHTFVRHQMNRFLKFTECAGLIHNVVFARITSHAARHRSVKGWGHYHYRNETEMKSK